MAKDNYVINIKALIDPSSKTNGTSNSTPPSGGEQKEPASNPKPSDGRSSENNWMDSLGALGGLRYAAGKVNALASVFGNEELTSAMQSVTKIGGYAVKGAKALTGDPVAIIDCIVSAVVDIASAIRKTKQEESAKLNEQDIARIRAGLFDIEGVNVSKDNYSGRLQYEAR